MNLFAIEKCVNAETGAMQFVAAFASEDAANAWAEAQGLQYKCAGHRQTWRLDYCELYEVSVDEFAAWFIE